MCIGLQIKLPVFLSDFNETCISSTDFQKNIQISNFMTNRAARAEWFHVE